MIFRLQSAFFGSSCFPVVARLRCHGLTLIALVAATISIQLNPLPAFSAQVQEAKSDSTPEASEETGALEERDNEFVLPDSLSGSAVTKEGQPVAGARVSVSYITWPIEPNTMSRLKTVHRTWDLLTDKDGVFTIDTHGLDTQGLDTSTIDVRSGRVNFYGEISAAGFVTGTIQNSARYIDKHQTLSTITMVEGKVISGRLVGELNGAGTKLVNPVIQLAGPNFWTSSPIKCRDDGAFEATVPIVGEVEIRACADNFATTNSYVPVNENVLDNIVLSPGTSVFGTVVDQEQQPVAGVVVLIRHDYLNNVNDFHRNFRLSPRSAVKTDSEGRFRLPPHLGPSTIAIVARGLSRESVSIFPDLHSDLPPPVVGPQSVQLDGSVQELEVNFAVVDPVILAGTVRWPDGSPAVGVALTSAVMAGGTGLDLMTAQTDESGSYMLHLPPGRTDGYITLRGARDASGKYFTAEQENEIPNTLRQQGHVSFQMLAGDVNGIDWRLKAKESATQTSSTTTSSPAETAREQNSINADNTLEEIAARFLRSEREYAAEVADARTREEKVAISLELRPNLVAYSQELVNLEEKYRGTPAALNAMRQVLQWTQETTDDLQKTIRESTLGTLSDHYLEHPDLDVCFSGLDSELELPQGEALLKAASIQGSSGQVRASAMLAMARYHADRLKLRDQLAGNDWKVPGMNDRTEFDQMRIADLVQELRDAEDSELRALVQEPLDALREGYFDLENQGFISGIGGWNLRRYVQDPGSNPTFGKLADDLSDQIEK